MKISAILTAILIVAAALSAAAERPQTYGFSLPYPVEIPQMVPAGDVPFLIKERLVTVVVDIDESGSVLAVTADSTGDARFASHISEYLKGVRFEPAVRDGEKVSARLPVILQYPLKARIPNIFFPVDTDLTIANCDLYFEALARNGYRQPQIETFPSFFSDVDWHDSTLTYPYMILGLSLDSFGKVTAADKVFASDPSFVEQLLSASLWAKFTPAQFDNRPVSSRCFLLVSQFPHTPYPTRVRQITDSSRQTYLESRQIRLVADTVGMMSVPILRQFPGDEIKFGGKYATFIDTAVAAVTVFENGRLTVQRLTTTQKILRNAVMKTLNEMKFFPALDYHGKPHTMHGLVQLTLTGSGTIRIRYFWLSL